MKKLKLLPLLFLILLSGQVQAKTWEQSMSTWAGIWSKVHSSNKETRDQGRKEMWAQYTDRTRSDPNYTYEQRRARIIAYAREHISTNYPHMTAATTEGIIDWIAMWHRTTVKRPLEDEGAIEQMLLDDESWLIYQYPGELADINAKQALPALEVKAPVAGVEWTTNQATFDYVVPCQGISYVAIVSNIANHRDPLTENDKGELVYERDMTIGYSRMADYCIAIAAPKTDLSTTYNDHGDAEHWRNWWMTAGVEDDNGIPVRDENAEIEATIALIKLAITAMGGPVYLVIGNDLGVSTMKVLNRLNRDGEANLVSGFIHIDRETGEFTTYYRDGTSWKSEDHPVDNTDPE